MDKDDPYSFSEGRIYNLDPVVLSEEEIINFAQAYDPLDFHTSREAAEKSYFKRLIASGPHVFNTIYKKQWLPMFGQSVICGMELNNWKFLRPVFVDMKVYPEVQILSVMPNPAKGVVAVQWRFEFRDEERELLQHLEMLILHKMQLN